MERRPLSACAVLLLALCLASFASVFAQTSTSGSDRERRGAAPGVLLLAHGGKQAWNDAVREVATAVGRSVPVEIAFGMASRPAIQAAIDRLVARGVSEIVAVPLFVSSHSSVFTATEYLLGVRTEAPPDLARFARMEHGLGSADGHRDHAAPPHGADAPSPVACPVPIRMTNALNRHLLVADILTTRARSISHDPSQEVVVLVAHGPVPDEDNVKWLADMAALVEQMRPATSFRRIEHLTVRDDAPEPVRSRAAAELTSVVQRASGDGARVLVVPLLLAYGGIEEGIRKRLEGLPYTMSPQALLPDERLIEWVRVSAGIAQGGR